VWHTGHSAPASGTPQFEQYLPDAGDWHVGHGRASGAGLVMRE